MIFNTAKKFHLVATALLLLQIVSNADAFSATQSGLFNVKVTNHEEDLDLTRRIILSHVNANDDGAALPLSHATEKLETVTKKSVSSASVVVGKSLSKLNDMKHHLIESSLRIAPSIRSNVYVVKASTLRSLNLIRRSASRSTVTSVRQTRRLTRNVAVATFSAIPTPLNLGDNMQPAQPVFGSSFPSFRLGNIVPLNRIVREMIFLLQQM